MADVNGSRFFLRQGQADWTDALAAAGTGLRYGPELGGVTLQPRLFQFPQRDLVSAPKQSARRNAAVDLYGNLYVIGGDEASIDIHPAGLGVSGRYWPGKTPAPAPAEGVFMPCPPPPAAGPIPLRGLTVTSLNYLVVGTLAPSGLLVLDLPGGGPPAHVRWPDAVPFAPFDMFPAHDGGLWILDRGPAQGAARWWRLDRTLRPVSGPTVELSPADTASFRPVAGGPPPNRPATTFPAGIDLATLVLGFTPVAIAGLTDESVLLLGRRAGQPHSTLLRARGGAIVAEVALDAALMSALLDPPVGLVGYEMTLHQDAAAGPTLTGQLRVLADSGNQAFEFAFTAAGASDAMSLTLLPSYYPVRGFAGRGLVEAGELSLYDLESRYVPLIAQPRPRFQPEGEVELMFDGQIPGLVWHRLAMDACIPSNDAIVVESRSAETEEELELADWRAEPGPYLRGDGAELAYHRPFASVDPLPRGAGTWELLFQRAVGRFLGLRLRFTGSGRTSPVLKRLRVWLPRFSYLGRYLPAVYRDDPDSASFLDRFLANVEGLFTTMEGRVANAQWLFDERTAPDEALEWLAGWLGADFLFLNEPERRRLLIAHAPLLWSWRGTPGGLMAFLRLVTDLCVDATIFEPLRTGAGLSDAADPIAPRLIELFRTRVFSPAALGDPGALQRPVLVSRDAPYDATQGPAPLHQAYRDFLRARYSADQDELSALAAISEVWGRQVTAFGAITFPPLTPAGAGEAADWRHAAASAFGFVYPSIDATDPKSYRAFLMRRYRRIADLNAAYGLGGSAAYDSFEDIPLPDAFSQNRTRLADWLDFATRATPIRQAAHRFAVLLPTDPAESEAERDARAARARAVIAREKPAHTDFEVRFFWSLLQVGTARLGIDTIVGEGARFTAVVLDRTPLGQGFLAESHPWSAADRRVVGRDTLMEV